jgi:hypothetical protein
MTTKPTLALDKEYVIIGKNGSRSIVSGRSPAEALGIFTRRGRFGLGSGWMLSRQPDGWIVATNKTMKNLERTQHKMREVNYTRGMR